MADPAILSGQVTEWSTLLKSGHQRHKKIVRLVKYENTLANVSEAP
jgi:hypothetical protein